MGQNSMGLSMARVGQINSNGFELVLECGTKVD